MIYRVKGGGRVKGALSVQGSKNAALPILLATLLVKGEVVLEHIPSIGDVRAVLSVLDLMGVSTHARSGTVTLNTATAKPPPSAAYPYVSAIRASSYLLGAGLARFGEMTLPPPGGCDFGGRPLDIHRAGLSAMGAEWSEEGGLIRVSAHRLRGIRYRLPYPSVGATVNLLLAALAAEGETRLEGVAREPHIAALTAFLLASGADIDYGEDTLTVKGGVPLHGCRYTVASDGIEAGTYLIAAAATGGCVTVKGVDVAELSGLLALLQRMGNGISVRGNTVTLRAPEKCKGTDVLFAPYPGIPTDLHPQLAVLLATTDVGGVLTDTVWPDRVGYVKALAPMGLRAIAECGRVRVLPSRLVGGEVTAPDLRAGAAALIAAAVAEGESRILKAERIARGYEEPTERLASLGIDISVETALAE